MLINDSLQIVTAIPRLIVLSCSPFLFKSDRRRSFLNINNHGLR